MMGTGMIICIAGIIGIIGSVTALICISPGIRKAEKARIGTNRE